MRSGSKWPVIGPRPCAAYVDLVFTSQSYDISISTSTRRTNLSVFLVLIIMSTKLALPYTCACAYAYAYALVKTMFNTSQILYRESLGGLSSVRTRTWRVVSSILTWSSEFFSELSGFRILLLPKNIYVLHSNSLYANFILVEHS